MIYLSDNDLVLKLINWNLMPDALSVLRAKESEIYLLETFKDQLVGRDEWREQYGQPVLDRALQFVSRVSIVNSAAPNYALEVTQLRKVMDRGEAILFASTADLVEFRVLTGDKRCLIALHQSAAVETIALRVHGRVLHLEQIILRIIEDKGLNYVRNKIQAAPKCDLLIEGAIRANNAEAVRMALLNSIRKLHTDCGGLLSLSDTEQPTGF